MIILIRGNGCAVFARGYQLSNWYLTNFYRKAALLCTRNGREVDKDGRQTICDILLPGNRKCMRCGNHFPSDLLFAHEK